MDDRYKTHEQAKKYNSRLLTPKEKKELEVNSVKRIKPFLEELEEWRRESLNSNFRF